LEDMQKLVGGYVEALPGKHRAMLYVNEEGKLHHLPPNPLANRLVRDWAIGMFPDDFIVGNVLVLGSCDKDGNETSCPAAAAEDVRRIYSQMAEEN